MRGALRGRLSKAALSMTCLLAAAPSAGAAAAPGVLAGRARSPIRLDGRLDEEAWNGAGVIADLVQQDPAPGEPTPYRTKVRVLADDEAIYFGVTCADPEPSRIAVHTMQRDGDFGGDDSVSMVLDTFGDRRNGYLFRVNASGARQDGLITDPETASLDWDGIWDARTRRGDAGWSAEIVVPARTLRFTPGLASWGFNVERYVARDRLTLRWSGATFDARLYDLRRAGSLAGLADLDQGTGLSVSPYGLARSRRDRDASASSAAGDVGLDVTFNLTPELASVITVNTDFAETEVDQRQINLTRFPLFFPEKRPFFLEGSNLFEFGLGLGSDFIPFFSRRVGLFEGRPITIDAGVKALGRSGRWGIALLDTVTGDDAAAPRTNLFASRVTYDVDDQLRVGAIATDGDPDGLHENAVGGLDAAWQTSSLFGDKNFAVGGWTARSSGDLEDPGPDPANGTIRPGTGSRAGGPAPNRRAGWGFKVDYPNDLWDLAVKFDQYGDALDAALGFLPRPGTRQYGAGIEFRPRPPEGPFDWARQFFFELRPARVDDLDGDPESWRVFTAPFNVETRRGDHFEANWIPQFERLRGPFEVAPGVVIPAGERRFTRWRIQAESSPNRPWSAGSTVQFGEFFGGRLTQWESFVAYTTHAGHVQIEAAGENDFGSLPEGDFVLRLFLLRSVFAVTPYAVLSALVQYDSDSRLLGVNARLRWTMRPGNDLFVVWNRSWRRLAEPDERFAFGPTADEIAVKLRWTFRG